MEYLITTILIGITVYYFFAHNRKVSAEPSKTFCELHEQLMTYIEDKKGVTVKEIKAEFPENYDIIKDKMYYLAKIGKLKKSKVGKYNFYEISKLSSTLN